MRTIEGTIEANAKKVAREYLKNEYNECDLRQELMDGEKHHIDKDVVEEYGSNCLNLTDIEDDETYWEELAEIAKLAMQIIENEIEWARAEFAALTAKISKRW